MNDQKGHFAIVTGASELILTCASPVGWDGFAHVKINPLES